MANANPITSTDKVLAWIENKMKARTVIIGMVITITAKLGQTIYGLNMDSPFSLIGIITSASDVHSNILFLFCIDVLLVIFYLYVYKREEFLNDITDQFLVEKKIRRPSTLRDYLLAMQQDLNKAVGTVADTASSLFTIVDSNNVHKQSQPNTPSQVSPQFSVPAPTGSDPTPPVRATINQVSDPSAPESHPVNEIPK